MKNLLVLAKPIDANVLHELMKNEFAESDFLVMSADAAEYAIGHGARNVNLVDNLWQNKIAMHYESDRLARSFDRECSLLREKYFGISDSQGWEYLNAYYLAFTIKRMCGAAQTLEGAVNKWRGRDIYTVKCEREQDYYFDSMWQRSALWSRVKNEVIYIDYTGGWSATELGKSYMISIPEVNDIEKLIHLPTVFYNRELDMARLSGYSAVALDIQSAYFDMQFLPQRIRLLPADHEQTIKLMPDGFLKEYAGIARSFSSLLGVAEGHVTQIVSRLISRVSSQVLVYYQLISSEYLKGVGSIELSDHDTGLQGPLISFARERSMDVLIVPHSEISIMPTQVCKKMKRTRCLHGASDANSLGFDYDCESVVLDFPMCKIDTGKRLVILLNEMDDASGLANLPLSDLRCELPAFVEALEQCGWEVRVRHKPSHIYTALLDRVPNSASGLIDPWLSWATHAMSLGEVTTALIKFRLEGVPCYHLQVLALTDFDKEILPNDTTTVAGQGFGMGLKKMLSYFEGGRDA